MSIGYQATRRVVCHVWDSRSAKSRETRRDDTCGIVGWFVVDVFWKQLALASRPLQYPVVQTHLRC